MPCVRTSLTSCVVRRVSRDEPGTTHTYLTTASLHFTLQYFTSSLHVERIEVVMSASPVARQAVAQALPQSIPRRVTINSPADLPSDYSTTPGGTLFSTTPGGEGSGVLCSVFC